MGIVSRSTFAGRAAAIVALLSASAMAQFDTPYCSSQNTGSGDAMNSNFQSNGLCTDHCNGSGTFAFAVIQFNNCWCTNYIPADQQDSSDCRVSCPGYPTEFCGDKDKDLFIYVQLAGTPSGTQGGSRPSTTDVSTAAPPPASTEEPPSSEAPTSTRATSTKRATSSADPPSTTEEPMTTATVVTESGVIVTRTVVFTPSSTPARGQTGDSDGNSSNTGAIVGGVVGGVAGLLAIVGGILFLLWRRRKQQQQLDGEGGQSSLNRNTSTMSKAGLLGGNGAEKHMQYPAAVATSGSQRSRHDDDSIGPLSASDRRYSQPVLVDSRLNPRAVLTFHGSNESRESLASIDDSRDYGRQLNVVNPDPSRD
ncbi:hypothetical protein NX059_000084 [Plenodomus lindquistii]|nr:hypothetical protein NX059_000084 [Plenodomus lindquistii]